MKYFQTIIQLCAFVLPWPVRCRVLSSLLGFEIDRASKIGFSVINAGEVRIGPAASIGHLNWISGLDRLDMKEGALIGHLNWVTGRAGLESAAFSSDGGRISELTLELQAAITNRHHIDCTHKILIGAYSIVAGWHSKIITHSIDIRFNKQRCAPVEIGRYCFIGAGVIILKGSKLPDYSILSAGSTLSHAYNDQYSLFSGNPAKKSGELPRDALFFSRTKGPVS